MTIKWWRWSHTAAVATTKRRRRVRGMAARWCGTPPHRATPAVHGEALNTGESQPGSEKASPEAGAATATSGDRRERST